MSKTVTTKLHHQPILFEVRDLLDPPYLQIFFAFDNGFDDIPRDWGHKGHHHELEVHFDIPEVVNDILTDLFLVSDFEEEPPEKIKLTLSLLREQINDAVALLDKFEKGNFFKEHET